MMSLHVSGNLDIKYLKSEYCNHKSSVLSQISGSGGKLKSSELNINDILNINECLTGQKIPPEGYLVPSNSALTN